MRVRILGAGPAGLACAVAMRRRCGFDDVIVLERDAPEEAALRPGHGLILMQNGVAALAALGADRFLRYHRALDRALFQDHRGLIVRAERMLGVYCVTRAGLIDALKAELPEDAVEYGRRCLRVELIPPLPPGRDPRTIRRHLQALRFDAGPPVTNLDADLFIGADGWRSVMYAAYNPLEARAHSAVFEIVTSTRMPELAIQLGSTFLKTLFADRGLAFGLLSPTPQEVIGFLQFDAERHGLPAGTAGPELAAFVAGLCGGAPEPVASYLRLADYASAHLWRPADADIASGLCGDNAVIIGDAAHPLLPFTSQGVGAALEDAVILADAVAPIGDRLDLLPRVLAGFSDDRRADLAGFVAGGRQILSHFLGSSDDFMAPYLEGAVSKLADHLSLPPTDLASLCRLFDADADGYLTRDEFHQALALILKGTVDTSGDALFAEFDADEDGRIDLEKMLVAIGSGGEASPALWQIRRLLTPRRVGLCALVHRVGAAFRAIDDDADGAIDFGEFATGLALFGVVGGLTPLRRLFDLVDADRDGRISEQELLEAVRQSHLQPAVDEDPLFADAAVDLPTLRQRAYNHRWAVHPPDVIPLTAADSDFPVSEEIMSAVHRYLGPGYVPYGPPEGLPELRRVAADTLQARNGLCCDPDTILPTDGAASAMFLVARMAITAAGDEAIIPDPVDFLLSRSVGAAGGAVRRWPIRNRAFDASELESLVTPRTRLISVCNPHNPLGRVLRRDELEAIAVVALRHRLWILSDEVWSDIVYSPHEHVSMASLDPEIAARTFTVFGFSKSYALAGMRLGLLVAPDAARRRQIVRLAHADDTAYGASTVSQIAGAAAYELGGAWLERFVAHLRRQRDYAVGRLNAIADVRCATPEGTFVVFPDVSRLGIDQDALAAALLDSHRIALVPGSEAFFGPGAAGHVRLSFATSRRILAEGLDRFEHGVSAQRSRKARPPSHA